MSALPVTIRAAHDAVAQLLGAADSLDGASRFGCHNDFPVTLEAAERLRRDAEADLELAAYALRVGRRAVGAFR
jgi:hypothetical protein